VSNARRAVLLDMGASGPRAREGGALAGSLSARGFSLERFGDAKAVLAALAAKPADVLIVDADSPSLDLREFVETLRADPRTARTLVVALASGDPRELPARREIALTLAKPINADDAASRLEGLVVTRQHAATNTRELRGHLSQISLPDLLQLLSVNRATGTLTVDAPGRLGTVVLDGGELRAVSTGPARGLKAFVRLLGLTEGSFVFTHGDIDPALAGEVLALGPMLFEATRHVDEIARLKPTLPEPWVEVRRSRAPMPAELEARMQDQPALGEVARLLATPRTLSALLDASPLPDADVLEALDAFRKAGLVEIAGGAVSDRVDVLESSYAAALVARMAEAGRSLSRVMVLVDPGPGPVDGALLRALGGLSGFVPAEGAPGGAIPLGTLGTLVLGGARVELFAVPAAGDLSPLWAVFGAGAQAAIVTARGRDGHEREVLAREVGLPVGVVTTLSTHGVADALRSALEQVKPGR
jgi:CheY-like chemotaxis protein